MVPFICKETITVGPRQFFAGALYYLPEQEFARIEKAHPTKVEVVKGGYGPQLRDKMLHCWRT